MKMMLPDKRLRSTGAPTCGYPFFRKNLSGLKIGVEAIWKDSEENMALFGVHLSKEFLEVRLWLGKVFRKIPDVAFRSEVKIK